MKNSRLHLFLSPWLGAFGIAFFFFTFLGRVLSQQHTLYRNDWLLAALGGLVLGALAVPLLKLSGAWLTGLFAAPRPPAKGDGARFWCGTALTFVLWVPVFLAYYPGVFSYDIPMQMSQTMGSFTTHHPLAHTLLIHGFYALGGMLGSHNLGVALYTLVQMALFAAAFGTLHLFLRHTGLKAWPLRVVALFMAFFPMNSMMAVSTTKDVFFAAGTLVSCVALGYFVLNSANLRRRPTVALYFVGLITMCLMRNNGIYIGVLSLLAVFAFPKSDRLRFAVQTVAALAVAVALNAVLLTVTAATPGSPNEMLSVPYQQLANVYNTEYDSLDSKTKAELETLMPSIQNYRSDVSDFVKSNATGYKNKELFAKTYFRLLAAYPKLYLEAFLMNTQGYWYLADTTHATIYGESREDRIGTFMNAVGYEDVATDSHFPALEELFETLFSTNLSLKIPVVSLMFSLAFYAWLILYAAAYAATNRIRRAVSQLVFLGALLLTMLAGPCALARYALPYMVCVPALFAATFAPCSEGHEPSLLHK